MKVYRVAIQSVVTYGARNLVKGRGRETEKI